MPFLPLHIYSGYSFLRSGLSMRKIVSLGLKNHYSYVGISDYQTMTGFPELYHLCLNREITPLFGMDVMVGSQRFTCYILEETGYRNLIELAHLASKGTIDDETFFSLQEGLAVILNAAFVDSNEAAACPFVSLIDRYFTWM